jgi:hypothetical protein
MCGGVGRTRISTLGMLSGAGFSPAIVGAMHRIVAHVAPAPGCHDDPTNSPYASCCSPARPFPSGEPSETWTWAVISWAAGVRVAAGERRGRRNPDSTARRGLLAAHCCSRASSSLAWRRRRHWRKQPRRPRHAPLITKKSKVGLASRRHPACRSRNPKQSCDRMKCRSRRRKLPSKCRKPGNRARRPGIYLYHASSCRAIWRRRSARRSG